jgi:hypothetical protein
MNNNSIKFDESSKNTDNNSKTESSNSEGNHDNVITNLIPLTQKNNEATIKKTPTKNIK